MLVFRKILRAYLMHDPLADVIMVRDYAVIIYFFLIATIKGWILNRYFFTDTSKVLVI